MQVLPRYPCFYSLLTKKQTPIFIHFFEKTLKHTFLFSKFIDPILIVSYYSVDPKDFNFSREFSLKITHQDPKLNEIYNSSKEIFKSVISSIIKVYPITPINFIQKVEILRVCCTSVIIQIEKLLFIINSLLSHQKNEARNEYELEHKLGTLELEQNVWDCLRVLRNVSLSLFMTAKLENWYEFLIEFGFAEIFTDCFEYVAVILSKKNFFKKDFVLKFLSFPVFQRRSEV